MPDSLYDTDLLAWSQAQGDRLRRIAAGERVNDLDWPNVIAEIEAVGRSELRAVRAFLGLALLHGLKIVGWPGHASVPHWRGEIANFLLQARHRFEPGMLQHLDLDDIYADARKRALGLGLGEPVAPLPETVALDAGRLMEPGFGAFDLVAILRGEDPPTP